MHMADRTLQDLMSSPDLATEILGMVEEITNGWYPVGRIDWEDVWDRLDDAELSTGDRVDVGEDLLIPEVVWIKKHIRDLRRDG